MSDMSEQSVEGRILAHRQILGAIVAELSGREGGAGVVGDLLERRQTFQGAEEDPGAVPDPGMAIEAALSDEMRLVSEDARRRAEGKDG